jgi:hypothetical protein
MRIPQVIIGAFSLMILTGCKTQAPGVPAECLNDDRFSNHITHFDPSNSVGACSLFEVKPEGGYMLYFSSDTLKSKYSMPTDVIHLNNPAACQNTSSNQTTVNAGVSLQTSAVKGISADLSTAIDDAESVEFAPATFTVEEIEAGNFEIWLHALPADNPFRQKLLTKGFVLMNRAVRLDSMKVTIHIKKDSSFDAKATFSPAAASAIANANGHFDVTANDEKTVVVSSTQPFYVEGELAQWSEGGAAAGAPPIKPAIVDISQEKGLTN